MFSCHQQGVITFLIAEDASNHRKVKGLSSCAGRAELEALAEDLIIW